MSSLSLDFTLFSAAFAAIFEIPSAADEAPCAFPPARTLPSCTLQPVARAVSLTALAIAGCGGLFFAAEGGALVSWGLPYFKPWQVRTALARATILYKKTSPDNRFCEFALQNHAAMWAENSATQARG